MARKKKPFQKTVVRYVDARGKECEKSAPGARKIKTKTKSYYGWVSGHAVPLETEDLGEAWVRLRKLLEAGGDASARARAAANAPLVEHIHEFAALIQARNDSVPTGHAYTVRKRLEKIAAYGRWTRADDLTGDNLTKGLALVRENGGSYQTSNHYRRTVLSFASWLGRKLGRVLLTDPPPPLNPEEDPRHPRRCPTDDEVGRLFALLQLPDCRVRWRMDGRRRAMMYKCSMATGFRAKELRTLTLSSFDLDARTVSVIAEYSKRRRLDRLPLPDWYADDIAAYLKAGGLLWSGLQKRHLGELLQADLRDCGVEYETHEGFFDFHALRVFYITRLAATPGITLKTLMELARHSTPVLTLKVYARPEVQAMRDAVNKGIPNPLQPPPQ